MWLYFVLNITFWCNIVDVTLQEFLEGQPRWPLDNSVKAHALFKSKMYYYIIVMCQQYLSTRIM